MTFLRRKHPRANERILAVEAGQVVCPRRGIVDIEQCWVCPAHRGGAPGVADGLLCVTEPITFAPRAGLI